MNDETVDRIDDAYRRGFEAGRRSRMVKEDHIAHSGGRTPIDEDGYVTLAQGRLHAEAFKERLRCGRLCDEFMRNHEHLRGTQAWYAANVIQAHIFGAK